MNRKLQRLVGAAAVTLAVSLAVAAQACASGGAAVYPNDRPGPLGVGGSLVAVVTSGALGRAVLRADRPLYPDDRAGLRWHGDSGRIGIYSDDRSGLRGASPTLTLS